MESALVVAEFRTRLDISDIDQDMRYPRYDGILDPYGYHASLLCRWGGAVTAPLCCLRPSQGNISEHSPRVPNTRRAVHPRGCRVHRLLGPWGPQRPQISRPSSRRSLDSDPAEILTLFLQEFSIIIRTWRVRAALRRRREATAQWYTPFIFFLSWGLYFECGFRLSLPFLFHFLGNMSIIYFGPKMQAFEGRIIYNYCPGNEIIFLFSLLLVIRTS